MRLRRPAAPPNLMLDGTRYGSVEEWEAALEARTARRERLLARLEAEGYLFCIGEGSGE